MLFGAGYQFAWFDGLNRYYLCTEQAHRKAALALQPNVFDNFMPYSEFVATRYWHESVLLHQLRSGIQAAERPRLAYCCPMPPDASGVAYYGASVLSQLARVYEVTVVTQRGSTTDPWVNSVALPVIDFERFAAQAVSFDRVTNSSLQGVRSYFMMCIWATILPIAPSKRADLRPFCETWHWPMVLWRLQHAMAVRLARWRQKAFL
jgi:hypothetical protein